VPGPEHTQLLCQALGNSSNLLSPEGEKLFGPEFRALSCESRRLGKGLSKAGKKKKETNTFLKICLLVG